MGSGCVCVFVCVLRPQHKHVTAILSPAHQWGYTSCLHSALPCPWCHPQWNEKTLIEKKKQEVDAIYCSAQKKWGKFYYFFGNHSPFLVSLWRREAEEKYLWLNCEWWVHWLWWKKLQKTVNNKKTGHDWVSCHASISHLCSVKLHS